MAQPLIDLSYLKSISMGSRDFELKLLATFAEQTAIEIKKIQEYYQQEDWDSLCASVHKIKPSFHFIGALETETLLNTVEDMSRNKTNTEKLPELVTAFLQVCKKILKEVKIKIEKYGDIKQ